MLYAGCDSTTSCKEGYGCDAGYCFKECQSTEDCPYRTVCYELLGRCYPTCKEDQECIGSQSCQEGGFCLKTNENTGTRDSG